MGNTQQGNNNAYCQDNELSWIDWQLDEENQLLLDFTRRIIQLRRKFAVLHHNHFFVGERNEDLDIKDVAWLAPSGKEMQDGDWHNQSM